MIFLKVVWRSTLQNDGGTACRTGNQQRPRCTKLPHIRLLVFWMGLTVAIYMDLDSFVMPRMALYTLWQIRSSIIYKATIHTRGGTVLSAKVFSDGTLAIGSIPVAFLRPRLLNKPTSIIHGREFGRTFLRPSMTKSRLCSNHTVLTCLRDFTRRP